MYVYIYIYIHTHTHKKNLLDPNISTTFNPLNPYDNFQTLRILPIQDNYIVYIAVAGNSDHFLIQH